MFFPILMSGINPSCFGGSTCITRIGAIAGIGPEAGGVLGVCGGLFCASPLVVVMATVLRVASASLLAGAVAGVATLKASISAAEMTPLSLRRSKRR